LIEEIEFSFRLERAYTSNGEDAGERARRQEQTKRARRGRREAGGEGKRGLPPLVYVL
jgi:hypothetical protein